MHASTRALEDDEAVSSRSVSGVAQPLSGEEIGPQAEYREQGNTRQRRDQTPVQWGQGIPIRSAVTTQHPTGSVLSRAAAVPSAQRSATPADSALSRAASADMASRLLLPRGIETPTSSALSSVSDAITRLQRESDLALRRIDELHVYYKKEIKTKEESHARRDSSINKNYVKVSGDLDQGKSLWDTQNLMTPRGTR